MRTTMTFILRLLLDSSEPEALRGVLQSVANGEEHPFSNADSLLKLLRLSQSDWLQETNGAQKPASDEDHLDSGPASHP